jgi:Domain of unknown function (DUF397)
MNTIARTHQQGSDVRRMTLGDRPGDPVSAPFWVKSSMSFANGNCVEVAGLPGGAIGVRNSRDPDGPVLRFTSAEWRAFLGGVRNGEFGPDGLNG